MELTFAVRGFFSSCSGTGRICRSRIGKAWLAAVLGTGGDLQTAASFCGWAVQVSVAPDLDRPRGLITVLLFLAAKHLQLPGYLDGTVMLVVLASSSSDRRR